MNYQTAFYISIAIYAILIVSNIFLLPYAKKLIIKNESQNKAIKQLEAQNGIIRRMSEDNAKNITLAVLRMFLGKAVMEENQERIDQLKKSILELQTKTQQPTKAENPPPH